MIPRLVNLIGAVWQVLPPGIHRAHLSDIAKSFAYNSRRRTLHEGLVRAVQNLACAGCRRIYVNGSYVTDKPIPGDYDACWDEVGVERHRLDPVFLDFSSLRARQKEKYGGEFFPMSSIADASGSTFFSIFSSTKRQADRKESSWSSCLHIQTKQLRCSHDLE